MSGGRSTRQWMLWAFKLHGCVDCGVRYPEVPLTSLHCDHRNPAEKNGTRSRNLVNGGSGNGSNKGGLLEHNSNADLIEELVKCDVVCAECHKKRTRQRAVSAEVVQYALFSGTGEAWKVT